MTKSDFIGVFDSGVGGISVLKALVAELPHEDFSFFGDSAHAPYGEKTPQEVRDLSRGIVDGFLADGAKAIVIACNTATSAAAPMLREAHPETPIIGVEPALKPATQAHEGGRVLVMATPMTLKLDKFHKLAETWGSRCEVLLAPCPGLAARIEQGNLDAPELDALLQQLVGAYRDGVDAVVLGCTHYPYVKRQIRRVLGDVEFFDGGAGTASQLRRRLAEVDALRTTHEDGVVRFSSSLDTPQELRLYERFFSASID